MRALLFCLALFLAVPALAQTATDRLEAAAADAGADPARAASLARAAAAALTEDQTLAPVALLPAPTTSYNFGWSVAVSGDRAVVGAVGDGHGGTNSGSAYAFEHKGGRWVLTSKLTASDAATFDIFGASVAVSGDRALVGAYGDGTSGSAYAFDLASCGVACTEASKIRASDAAGGDQFGFSVAVSGDRAVVGAYGDDDGGSASGSAYVFDLATCGSACTEASKLTASDADADDQFGYSVAVSGDRAVMGAYNETGSAYAFEYDGQTWTQTSKLTASDAAADDQFGFSVAVSGGVAVVGAYGDDDGGNASGSAYAFDLASCGAACTETSKLTASDNPGFKEFGYSVAISGTRALVGAWRGYEDPFDPEVRGSAYVFDLASCGAACTEASKLTASDGAEEDLFGFSVAVSGDRVVVGALWDDDGGTNSGGAFAFDLTPFGGWNEQKLTDHTQPLAPSDVFGYSVAISGDRAVVGAYRDDDDGTNSGSAYAFEYDGGAWIQTSKLTAFYAAADDHFGYSVAVSGDRAVVGAKWDDDDGSASGSAYVFDLAACLGVCTETSKLTASDAAAGDEFGYSVSVSGDRALVGARYDDDGGDNSGSAYAFDLGACGATCTEASTLTASDAAAGDFFGSSVSVSGDRAVVGAWAKGGGVSGSAYAFDLATCGATCTETSTLAASDAAAFARFGYSVAVSGDRAVVGAITEGANTTGSAYAFDLATCGATCTETSKLTASDAARNDEFGYSVAVSGRRAVVGAHNKDDGAAFGAGRAYVFDLAACGATCTEEHTVAASDAASGDRFGGSVALSGDRVFVGAHSNDTPAGADAGSAYALRLPPLPIVGKLGDSEGYRMLAHPVGGTVDDLLGSVWTQGFPGSDDATPTDGFCSVYTYDETVGAFEGAYVCAADQSAGVPRGSGLLAFTYEDDDRTTGTVDGGFPKVLSVTGTADAPFSAFPITYTDGDTAPAHQEGWNLLGNPLADAFDWDLATRSADLAPTVYVYDPNYFGGDYRSWTAGSAGDLAGGIVPALQGFFAKATGAAPALTIPPVAAVYDEPDVHGKSASAALRFELAVVTASGEAPVSAAFVAATPGAALGMDALDAYRLTPGAWPRTVLATRATDADGAPIPLALNALPADAAGEVAVPLEVAAEGHPAGTLDLALSWTGALPEGWTAQIADHATGTRVAVAPGGRYTFSLDVPAATKGPHRPASLGLDLAPPALRTQERAASGGPVETGDRFALVLTPPSVVVGTEGDAPAFALGPVAPNPSRGRASLALTLATAGPVTVAVYDALGRLVASSREERAAGAHRLEVPTHRLATGAYVVRVEAPGGTGTRRLTVVR